MRLPSFALHDLGWHAFQQLCHTALREVLGQEVVSFLDVRDGGRDGAFAGRWTPRGGSTVSGQFVAQCKHTAKAGTNVAPADFIDELSKIERLSRAGRCDVYILMTNAGVTGESERHIVEAVKACGVEHVLVLGATWLNQTITESSRLRRLVPRLYGLGDLTQILDERSYRQAHAVLDAMRSDLDKLVLTTTYERAATALTEHSFVLLVGAPATGKTTIAAQLALGAADEFQTAVVKLDYIADLQDRWNPDERQLFWLDDAFGATQFDRSLARAWTTSVQRVGAAIKVGSVFVVTSRDYVFRAAYGYLKPGSFPLFDESKVVVDVSDLTLDEKRQIPFNHLRHGRQPNGFLARLQPNLEVAAGHPGFTPELARRLADPAFTEHLLPGLADSVSDFLDRPSELLRDVLEGLDNDGRAALGLIFINHDWLESPVALSAQDVDLLQRLGSDLGGVTRSLESLRGSLVQHVVRDGQAGWVFSHPTMVDAYADLLRSPELLYHLLTAFPLDVLLGEISCGDVGVQGAVVVPPNHFPVILNRLKEPLPTGDMLWRARDRRTGLLATRCDADFLRSWLQDEPARIERFASPGLMLEADSDNELAARLNECGLLPETLRSSFAAELIEYCVSGVDPAVLWNDQLGSILTLAERENLFSRVRGELLPNFRHAISACVEGWSHDYGPESAVQPLRELVYYLPRVFPDDDGIESRAKDLDRFLDEWVAEQDWEDRNDHASRRSLGDSGPSLGRQSERSVFDDLLDGRSDT